MSKNTASKKALKPAFEPAPKKAGREDTGRHTQPPRYSEAARAHLEQVAAARGLSMSAALDEVVREAPLKKPSQKRS